MNYLQRAVRDPFYSFVYKAYGSVEIVRKAGFFEDPNPLPMQSVNQQYGMDNLCDVWGNWKSIASRIRRCPRDNKVAITVTSGSFNPFHTGHHEMMKLARRELENRGYVVPVGIISPSHDVYVRRKERFDGPDAYVGDRMHTINLSIRGHDDTLFLDRWEAEGVPFDINWTDVLQYVQHHTDQIDREVDIFFVFGGDCAGFAYCFDDIKKTGFGGICVSRGEDSNIEEIRANIKARGYDGNVLWLTGTSKASSSAIRKGEDFFVTAAAREYWTSGIEENLTNSKGRFKNYIIRDDTDLSTEVYRAESNVFSSKIGNFKSKLLDIMVEALSPRRIGYRSIDHDVEKMREILRDNENATVGCFDQWIVNIINDNRIVPINRCRRFTMDDQRYGLWQQTRPETPHYNSVGAVFEHYINNLDANEENKIVLVDDDSVTGRLFREFEEQLLFAFEESDYMDPSFEHHTLIPHEYDDVLDARDFIFGASYGGLVVEDDMRVPYIYPLVNLTNRASVAPAYQHQISKEIIRANYELFKDTGLRLLHAGIPFQNFAERHLHLEGHVLMEDVCLMLERLLYPS